MSRAIARACPPDGAATAWPHDRPDDDPVEGADAAPTRQVRATAWPAERRRRIAGGIGLGVVIGVAAPLAVLLHRKGPPQGDDFALYLRQARSLFDGDMAQVVADNRFTVLNSPGPFSPVAYPWGWPLLLAPFVHVWGYDFDRLKLLEVACFCGWLVLVHGIVRRRAGRLLAFAIVAVVGTAPMLLAHTDFLLSEYPHALALGVFVWWLDRITADGTLLQATTRRLVVLGVLAGVAYNVRRESVVLVGVIAITQLVAWATARRHRMDGVARERRRRRAWRAVGAPCAGFVAFVVGFQLLLPSMLIPDNDDTITFVPERIGDYLGSLTRSLGLATHENLGAALLLVALAGMVVGCWHRPRLNVPLAALALLSTLAVSTHLRLVERYYFQVLPWVLYFAATFVIAVAGAVSTVRWRRLAPLVAVVPLLYVVGVHAVVLPAALDRLEAQERGGRQQFGPADPVVQPIFQAVLDHTPPDAVITYYRARTMTLLTDRRAIQTRRTQDMLERSDYFAQLRNAKYSQPDVTPFAARELGLEEVWSDARWVLWKVPPPPD
ncbi:MAG: hypothetical protein ACR2HP_19140 [Ilumatobacteraceae bacterium]